MRKYLIMFIILIFSLSAPVYASDMSDNGTQIPSMNFETLLTMMQARQGKVDIIKKNNGEITSLKEELKNKILETAQKVNNLRIEVSNETIDISDETILELKTLLEFLQEAKVTLENDVEKISTEIEEILDLISTRSMALEQYDLLIEKQNTVIVKMKEILEMVNKI